MKKFKKLLPVVVGSAMAFSVQAGDTNGRVSDFDFSVGGDINANYSYNQETEAGAFSLNESVVTLSAEWKKKVKAVLTLKLEEAIKSGELDDLEWNDDFTVEEFIKEAYIEIKNIGGSPVAVIVGKHEMAFGQQINEMPIWSNNPLEDSLEIDEVYGITLRLDKGILGIIDSAELSLFETGDKDLELGDINGVSLRLTKNLSDRVRLTLSHANTASNVDGDLLEDDATKRTSIGLVYKSANGKMKAWAEVLKTDNQSTNTDSIGATAGVAVEINERGTTLIVEGTVLEDELTQLAFGVKQRMSRDMTLGLDARFNKYEDDNKEDEFIIGINANYRFGSSSNEDDAEYLFN